MEENEIKSTDTSTATPTETSIIPKRKGRPPGHIKKYKDPILAVDRNLKKEELFLQGFVKHNGNATSAAMEAFKPKTRLQAANMGKYYLKKLRVIAQIYLEEKGTNYGKLLDMAVRKAEESKTPEWWDRLMKLGGYEDFLSKKSDKPSLAVNIINTQKKLMEEFVEGEVVNEDILDED